MVVQLGGGITFHNVKKYMSVRNWITTPSFSLGYGITNKWTWSGISDLYVMQNMSARQCLIPCVAWICQELLHMDRRMVPRSHIYMYMHLDPQLTHKNQPAKVCFPNLLVITCLVGKLMVNVHLYIFRMYLMLQIHTFIFLYTHIYIYTHMMWTSPHAMVTIGR